MKIVIDIPDKMYSELLTWKFSPDVAHRAINAITKGRILPEGAEILTKEAYSDLCLRASNGSKTGRWIEKDGWDGDVYYDCSACGESWTTIEGTPWDNGMNYCPNCGAKMKGCADMKINRMNCKYRHDNGNCLKVGGFCMSVDDKYCLKAESEEGAEE